MLEMYTRESFSATIKPRPRGASSLMLAVDGVPIDEPVRVPVSSLACELVPSGALELGRWLTVPAEMMGTVAAAPLASCTSISSVENLVICAS